jgi:hypothetical protein
MMQKCAHGIKEDMGSGQRTFTPAIVHSACARSHRFASILVMEMGLVQSGLTMTRVTKILTCMGGVSGSLCVVCVCVVVSASSTVT